MRFLWQKDGPGAWNLAQFPRLPDVFSARVWRETSSTWRWRVETLAGVIAEGGGLRTAAEAKTKVIRDTLSPLAAQLHSAMVSLAVNMRQRRHP
jgi:hypothetical protein